MGFIGFGEFNKQYILIFISYFLISQILFILLNYCIYNDSNTATQNISLLPLTSYIGYFLCFIPHIIINIFYLNKKYKLPKIRDHRKNKLVIEYIFNDLSDRVTLKDIISIFLVSIILLIVDFIKVIIQIKSKTGKIIFNDQYYFIELVFLCLFSYLFYKIKFYRHQYFSLGIIMVIGLFRFIIKYFFYYENNNYTIGEILYNLLHQIIIGGLESITIIYAKGLMEYKYFTPFKVNYIFGIINGIILIIILIILSYIPCGTTDTYLCSVEYNSKYYIDNMYKIYDNYKLYQFGILLICAFCYGSEKVLINYTVDKFTVFHIFLLTQVKEFMRGVMEELETKTGGWTIRVIFASYILEIFVSLIFIEIIELRFCNLNKNMKKKIKERALEDYQLTEMDDGSSRNFSSNYSISNSGTIRDSNSVNNSF